MRMILVASEKLLVELNKGKEPGFSNKITDSDVKPRIECTVEPDASNCPALLLVHAFLQLAYFKRRQL